jgi:hypothetical protein
MPADAPPLAACCATKLSAFAATAAAAATSAATVAAAVAAGSGCPATASLADETAAAPVALPPRPGLAARALRTRRSSLSTWNDNHARQRDAQTHTSL